MSLTTWTHELSEALGVDLDLDIDEVLQLAADAAHSVERPAAPLTTFLVGYAAGRRGGSEKDVAHCMEIASDLASEHDEDDA